MIKFYTLFFFIISLINGCSSVETETTRDKPSSEQSSEASPEPFPEPKVISIASAENISTVVVKKSPPPSRQAVLTLLEQSKSAMERNDYSGSQSLLTRALRIEPDNAWLWHNMAVLKFYQEDYQQAIQYALKSNNLEKQDPQLKNSNAQIINQSYLELDQIEKIPEH